MTSLDHQQKYSVRPILDYGHTSVTWPFVVRGQVLCSLSMTSASFMLLPASMTDSAAP